MEEEFKAGLIYQALAINETNNSHAGFEGSKLHKTFMGQIDGRSLKRMETIKSSRSEYNEGKS